MAKVVAVMVRNVRQMPLEKQTRKSQRRNWNWN